MSARASRPRAAKTPSPPRPRPAPIELVDTLAGAAWIEADAALAEALAEADALGRARSDKARHAALELLQQALARAARKRGLSRVGEVGAPVKYDAARHELMRAPKRRPRQVRVAVPGVARGDEILIKARANPVRPKPPVKRA